MPARLLPSPTFRAAFKPFQALGRAPPLCIRIAPRSYSSRDERPLPKADKPGSGPKQQQLPHVSEEAATMSKITGEQGPELEKGTPVEEVFKRDKEAQEKAPQVLKSGKASEVPKGSRSYSTTARRRQDALVAESNQAIEDPGHKFGLPTLPIPQRAHLKHRYDPVVDQVTQLLMKDGKKSLAQKNMERILDHLRTSPPPIVHPQRPLLPNSPPASHLPLNPILYLTLAIDSVAPLMRIKAYRGAAGGGMALQIPTPLPVRARRRTAVKWILDVVSKKKFRGSGRGGFAHKVAEEIIAIVEGKSSVWDRRGAVHKVGVGARSNLNRIRRRQ